MEQKQDTPALFNFLTHKVSEDTKIINVLHC